MGHRVGRLPQEELAAGAVGRQRRARGARAELGAVAVGQAQQPGLLVDVATAQRVAVTVGALVMLLDGAQPVLVTYPSGFQHRAALGRVLQDDVALLQGGRVAGGRELALQLHHRQVHRQRGLEGADHRRLVPAEPLGHQARDDGRVQAVAQRVLHLGPAALAHGHEHREVGVLGDEFEHGRGGLVQRLAQAGLARVDQDRPHLGGAVRPRIDRAPRRLGGRRLRRLGRHVLHAHEGAAVAQGIELLDVLDPEVAVQQQLAPRVEHRERQRFLDADAVLDGRKWDVGRHWVTGVTSRYDPGPWGVGRPGRGLEPPDVHSGTSSWPRMPPWTLYLPSRSGRLRRRTANRSWR
jgi:hypothetical protein